MLGNRCQVRLRAAPRVSRPKEGLGARAPRHPASPEWSPAVAKVIGRDHVGQLPHQAAAEFREMDRLTSMTARP